jgi:hypothetical protein
MIQIVRDVRSPESTHLEMKQHVIGDLTVGIIGDYNAFVLVG